MEEENKDSIENEQTIMVSSVKEREERQRNKSPIGNLSLHVREYHQEKAESSMQQSNGEEILEMLRIMEQSMRERDSQLRIQLQLRDEYFDVEPRRRDQFMEEALKQRDMEWKKELEERDEMWRVELKERDEEYWRGQKERDGILSRTMERRDQAIQNCLVCRDQGWLNGLHHYKESLRLMTMEYINNKATLESIGKR